MLRAHKMSQTLFNKLKQSAHFCRCYDFFDVGVRIFSNRSENLESFYGLYDHFRCASLDGLHSNYQKIADYFFLTDTENGFNNIIFWNAHTFWEILEGVIPPLHAEQVIFDSALTIVKSHYFLHGASFCFKNKGIALCGISGAGKTTLSLELARRGLQLLSDDIIAVDNKQGYFYPFSRIISCDEKTCRLVDEDNRYLRYDSVKQECDKPFIIDPLKLMNQNPPGSCPGKIIIFLEPSLDTLGCENKSDALIVEVGFFDRSEEFIKKIAALENIRLVKKCENTKSGITVLSVLIGRDQRTLFKELCRSMKDSVVHRLHRSFLCPDPTRKPLLEPVEKKKALKKLLFYFKNRTIDFYFNENPELTKVTANVAEIFALTMIFSYYRLIPGNLKETADLLEAFIVKELGPTS